MHALHPPPSTSLPPSTILRAQTMVYALTLTGSWRSSHGLIGLMFAGGTEEPGRSLAIASGVTSYVLLALQALLFLKYCRNTLLLVVRERRTCALHWRRFGSTRPLAGHEMSHFGLSDALNRGSLHLSPQEIRELGVQGELVTQGDCLGQEARGPRSLANSSLHPPTPTLPPCAAALR